MIDLDAYPRPANGVVGRVVESTVSGVQEAVVVNPSRGKINVLNDVGARIWTMVDGQHSGRQIAAVICDEYNVDQSIAVSDIIGFLEDLLRRGAIVMEDQPVSNVG